jgi:hypothetical protein
VDGCVSNFEPHLGPRFTYDIQSSDQLAANPQLWEGWPVGKLLQTLSDFVVGQNVEEAIFHAVLAQQGHELSRESTLWCAWGALHEQHYWRSLDELAESLVEVVLLLLDLGGRVLGRSSWVAGSWRIGAQILRWGRRLARSDLLWRWELVGAVCKAGRLCVLLNRSSNPGRITSADGLEDLLVSDKGKEGNGSDVVDFADIWQFLRVNGDPGGAWWLSCGIGGSEGLEDGGHLSTWRSPWCMEGKDQKGFLWKSGDVAIEFFLRSELSNGGHCGGVSSKVGGLLLGHGEKLFTVAVLA